jgi:hypothetical protein
MCTESPEQKDDHQSDSGYGFDGKGLFAFKQPCFLLSQVIANPEMKKIKRPNPRQEMQGSGPPVVWSVQHFNSDVFTWFLS